MSVSTSIYRSIPKVGDVEFVIKSAKYIATLTALAKDEVEAPENPSRFFRVIGAFRSILGLAIYRLKIHVIVHMAHEPKKNLYPPLFTFIRCSASTS